MFYLLFGLNLSLTSFFSCWLTYLGGILHFIHQAHTSSYLTKQAEGAVSFQRDARINALNELERK